ncbi:hypothetical protein FIBSPDRAFT_889031 [Athelia psychrophila]|uniref:Uncharacterized protein n=1 Tax=Athelia psychrophila TaxID=1759441 RepID=A0A166MUL6_9AGAM|nr:hypothetical protein FIBSPDRAFT_889031 [Fibularhizoctonia sp. CBS 109695]
MCPNFEELAERMEFQGQVLSSGTPRRKTVLLGFNFPHHLAFLHPSGISDISALQKHLITNFSWLKWWQGAERENDESKSSAHLFPAFAGGIGAKGSRPTLDKLAGRFPDIEPLTCQVLPREDESNAYEIKSIIDRILWGSSDKNEPRSAPCPYWLTLRIVAMALPSMISSRYKSSATPFESFCYRCGLEFPGAFPKYNYVFEHRFIDLGSERSARPGSHISDTFIWWVTQLSGAIIPVQGIAEARQNSTCWVHGTFKHEHTSKWSLVVALLPKTGIKTA